MSYSVVFVGAVHATQWAKTYSGAVGYAASSVQTTVDGGYIVAGYTNSYDAWVLKLDASGNAAWQNAYGGVAINLANSVRPTADGGYIVAGVNGTNGPPALGRPWALKLDANGNLAWQRAYDVGAFGGWATSVRLTADGGYILAGFAHLVGSSNVWVLKLDASGNVAWQNNYGGDHALANSVQPTADGGYIVAGYTSSFGDGFRDAWLLKLDVSGNVTWQRTYGGTGYDIANSVQPTADGGYIVAGDTNSFGAGGYDVWLLKVDASGNVIWQKTYGGTGDDHASSVETTADGGYIVAGSTNSFGAGGSDAWLLKLDASGNVIWQKTYGGIGDDSANSVETTADGGYIVAGQTIPLGPGNISAWVLKLDANGFIAGCPFMGTSNAVPANSSAIVGNTTTTVAAIDAPPIVTTANQLNSTATTQQQCYYDAAPVANVPTLSEWGMILMSGLLGACGAVMMWRDRKHGVGSHNAG